MATPQQNTKIETLVEAIETFSIAIAQDVAAPPAIGAGNAINRATARSNARAEMVSALRDFIAPALRVAESRRGEDAPDYLPSMARG